MYWLGLTNLLDVSLWREDLGGGDVYWLVLPLSPQHCRHLPLHLYSPGRFLHFNSRLSVCKPSGGPTRVSWGIFFRIARHCSPLSILQISLSSCPLPSRPLRWPIMEWIMVRMKIFLGLHHSEILRLWEWSPMQSFQIIFDLSRERFLPSNIGFRISNKWPGTMGNTGHLTSIFILIRVIPDKSWSRNINFSSWAHILTWLARQECQILWSEIRELKSRQRLVITTSGDWGDHLGGEWPGKASNLGNSLGDHIRRRKRRLSVWRSFKEIL